MKKLYVEKWLSPIYRFILPLLLSVVTSTAFAQLSGNYTINPSGSGSSNYASFTAAASALNSNGVSGDVHFEVVSGSFSNNISLSAFSGSGSYDVVFKGAGIDSTTITSSTNTVQLSGGDNITFRDMKIASTGARAVDITSTSDDCSFRNCEIDAGATSSSSRVAVYTSGARPANLVLA